MPILASEIERRLLAAFPGANVTISDLTGGGDHFSATIVTGVFEGKSLIDRHRLVYAALGESMKGDIHALALTTRTPDEP